ncbi:MAG TPA: SPOR domain-containing protein [Candidatus Acidoferrum sp.]|nr:SPOR domain-containing protein [Candidatus Acidoferrum sp.]
MLESRHLVGLFLGVVLLCGVFFTLGYVMGHTQYDSAVHAASSPLPRSATVPKPDEKAPKAANPPAPAPNEWDFYAKKDDSHLEPAPKPSAPAVSSRAGQPAPTVERPVPAPATLPAHFQPPKMLKNSIVLQLAALRRQSDALALADALQQKRFPSFVVTPTTDSLYRVQVGPYANEAEAESAKRALDREGFKAIIKR